MQNSSQDEQVNPRSSGRDAIGDSPSASSTNASGPERPHPSDANPPSGFHSRPTSPGSTTTASSIFSSSRTNTANAAPPPSPSTQGGPRPPAVVEMARSDALPVVRAPRRTYFEIMAETPEGLEFGLHCFRMVLARSTTAEERSALFYRLFSEGPSDQAPETPPESKSQESLE